MRELTTKRTNRKGVGVVKTYMQSPTADTVSLGYRLAVSVTRAASKCPEVGQYPPPLGREADEVLSGAMSMEAKCG